MEKQKEIKRLKRLCVRHGLEGVEAFDGLTNYEIAEMFNGIGPERFPAWLRKLLDALHPSLAPVALIHDVEWARSDGTRKSFTESNRRFRRNGFRIARGEFAWWRPRRYAVMWSAWKFARMCQRFGWGAWREPFERRTARGGVAGCVLAALLLLGGCAAQTIRQFEYYEPTEATAFRREDGLTVGAVKSETVKTGSPDWSDSKTISLISVGK